MLLHLDIPHQFGEMIQLSEDTSDVWVLLARGRGGGSPRLLLMSGGGEVKRLSPDELLPSVAIVGALDLPEPVRTRDDAYRGAVVELMRQWAPKAERPPIAFDQRGADSAVATCPSLPEHLGWVRRSQRLESEIRRLEQRRGKAGSELVTRFRSIMDLLEEFGYTRGWSLTEHGERLRFVYNELDLLLGSRSGTEHSPTSNRRISPR